MLENNSDWEISSQGPNRTRFIDYFVRKYAKRRKWGASQRDEDIVSALWKHREIEFNNIKVYEEGGKMRLPGQKIEIIARRHDIMEYYKNLGYDAEINKKFIVDAEDLQPGSGKMIDVECDFATNKANVM